MAASRSETDTHHFVSERVAHGKTLKVQLHRMICIMVQDGFGQSGDVVPGVSDYKHEIRCRKASVEASRFAS